MRKWVALALVLMLALAAALPLPAESSAQEGIFTSLWQLNGKRIGVQVGTDYELLVEKLLPEAEISFYNSYPDLAAALETNKIDGFPGDEPVLKFMAAEDSQLAVLPEDMDPVEMACVLPRSESGRKLAEELNAWIVSAKESGEMDEIAYKWIEGPESEKTIPDYASFPAPKGTLRMVTEGAYTPMNYFRGTELVGFEIDMAARFCEAGGYGLIIEVMNFDAIVPAIQAGKADFAAASFIIEEERQESVVFSEPYIQCGTMMAVLKGAQGESESLSFWEGIRSSFNKTFLREDRWILFVNGILNTLLITALSMLFGTALGFGLFMMCRKGNRFANAVTGFATWLIKGMPMVVLLMILYYVVFGNVAISGLMVSVVGFSLTFGASVFGLLQMGVGAVDKGQYEAAYALGHSDRRTFYKIIHPQALPHILPQYKGEVVSLIQSTAIVGYIAVQDLTKMGDIVRSRTYEAFFPLIAVTIIYFLLEGLLGFLISRINVSIDPKKRSRERILKGVKIHD
ncbi:MAG: ABC transporter substrate-binding protein/permease [Clostridia bacterium]|nr:ABC transporter substrate-binding protein/permease [Clostridia bacterium]